MSFGTKRTGKVCGSRDVGTMHFFQSSKGKGRFCVCRSVERGVSCSIGHLDKKLPLIARSSDSAAAVCTAGVNIADRLLVLTGLQAYYLQSASLKVQKAILRNNTSANQFSLQFEPLLLLLHSIPAECTGEDLSA